MKSPRIRTLLKIKGYKKCGECYAKEIKCFDCNGSGIWAGWISNGTYPHIYTEYREPEVCNKCEGSGIGYDFTSIEFEKYYLKL